MLIPHPALPAPDSTKSIFINCPYDDEYEPLFDALVFTIISCGFIPRCARESGKVSVPRMERIFHAVYTSHYSIHDLSRCQGEGDNLLARFNMPLELGLAMSRRHLGHLGNITTPHEWLVLVPLNAPYVHFISDLAGYDLKKYKGDTMTLVPAVLAWLLNIPGAIPWRTPSPILEGLNMFVEKKRELKAEWGDDIPWNIFLEAAQTNVPELN